MFLLSPSSKTDFRSDHAYIHDVIPYDYTLVFIKKHDTEFTLALVPSVYSKLAKVEKRYFLFLIVLTIIEMILAYFTFVNDFNALIIITFLIFFPISLFILIFPYNLTKKNIKNNHFETVKVLWQQTYRIDQNKEEHMKEDSYNNIFVSQFGILQLINGDYSIFSTLDNKASISGPIPYLDESEEKRKEIVKRMYMIDKTRRFDNILDNLPCVITPDKKIVSLIPLKFYKELEEKDLHFQKIKGKAIISLLYNYLPFLDEQDGNYYLVEDGLFIPNKTIESAEQINYQRRFLI